MYHAEQQTIFENLRSQEAALDVGGDMRADSPGHCAMFGSYCTMDLKSNTILHMELLQVSIVSYLFQIICQKSSIISINKSTFIFEFLAKSYNENLNELSIRQIYEVYKICQRMSCVCGIFQLIQKHFDPTNAILKTVLL